MKKSGVSKCTTTSKKVSVFDAANCSISDVSIVVWKTLLENNMSINLKANNISWMPVVIANISLGVRQLSLGFNPWACTCESRWMRNWILNNEEYIYEYWSNYYFTPKRLNWQSSVQAAWIMKTSAQIQSTDLL